jgi:DNA modification methylase
MLIFLEPFSNMSKKYSSLQPSAFEVECSTVWSFPRRGKWATHNSKYRGNWSPDVVRNILLRYSQAGDWIVDPMIGGGTTAVECKLLGRNIIAFDINQNAIDITNQALEFPFVANTQTNIEFGDARVKLTELKTETVDCILHHPPYADIIQYSDGEIEGDLSNIHDIDLFCDEMEKIAKQCFRLLKPGKFCAILIGDTRRKKMYQPMAFKVMERFLRSGFELKEDIVKVQHNCKAT